jgi:hypothetical protein
MKKALFMFFVLCALFALIGCDTVKGVVSNALSSGASQAVSSASTAVMDFKAGEVLCSTSASPSMIDQDFYLAKVQTAASAATKNQAEVIWIENGRKEWVNYVIESRKATKDEIKVGTIAFFPSGWNNYDTMDQDNYRKTSWILGRVTDVSDLFKGRVEISGNSFNVALLRVPTSPVN